MMSNLVQEIMMTTFVAVSLRPDDRAHPTVCLTIMVQLDQARYHHNIYCIRAVTSEPLQVA